MKRNSKLFIFTLLLIVFCLVCLVACGEDDDDSGAVKPFTVTFVTNGGTPIAPVSCTEAKSFKNILGDKTTTKDGKKFDGWFTDESLQNKAAQNLTVSADKTFYAGWRDYTTAEILANAVDYAYENALAVSDVGYVVTGTSGSDAANVNAVWTLNKGQFVSGHNSNRYFSDGALYGVVKEQKTKLIPETNDVVAEYLYHNNIFRSKGFFDIFSPLVMGLAADDDGCVLTVTDEGYEVKYIPMASAVQYRLVKYGTPYVYFTCGKTFEFKIVDSKLTEVKHSGGSKTRTIKFFYDSATLPEVSEPEDKTEYTQKWQLQVDIAGGGTKPLYVEGLNKQWLDKECFTDDYKPQTSKLTYYYDSDKTQAIPFDNDGNATINKHMTIYHPGVDRDNVTIASYDVESSTAYIKTEATSDAGVKTTTLMLRDETNSIQFSLSPRPYNAKNPDPTVTLEGHPEGDDALFEDLISVTHSSGATYYNVSVSLPVTGTYMLKIVSDDGYVCQYVKIVRLS